MSALPPKLTKLEHLSILKLNNACFKDLSESIGHLKNLTKLDLQVNPGLLLPDTFGRLGYL